MLEFLLIRVGVGGLVLGVASIQVGNMVQLHLVEWVVFYMWVMLEWHQNEWVMLLQLH
jgi:hypothetical protein